MGNAKYKLYAFEQTYGRAGTLNMLFVATDDEIEALLGRSVPWCECLGKYSQSEYDFNDNTVSVVDIDDNALNILLRQPRVKIEFAEEFLNAID